MTAGAKNSDNKDFTDEMIRDQLVAGIADVDIHKEVLALASPGMDDVGCCIMSTTTPAATNAISAYRKQNRYGGKIYQITVDIVVVEDTLETTLHKIVEHIVLHKEKHAPVVPESIISQRCADPRM